VPARVQRTHTPSSSHWRSSRPHTPRLDRRMNSKSTSSRRAPGELTRASSPLARLARRNRVQSAPGRSRDRSRGRARMPRQNARDGSFFVTKSQQHRLRYRHSPPHARAHAIAHGCHARAHTAATQRTRLRTRAHHRGTSAAIGRGAHRIDRRRCGAAALTVD
jgi:hypothetical protein